MLGQLITTGFHEQLHVLVALAGGVGVVQAGRGEGGGGEMGIVSLLCERKMGGNALFVGENED